MTSFFIYATIVVHTRIVATEVFMDKHTSKYYELVSEILTSGHWLNDNISALLKVHNISEPQYNVLRILEDEEGLPITVKSIQERMYKKSSNVTRIVDKLIEKGLVNRSICAENRRKMEITLTKEGLNLVEKLNVIVRDFHSPISAKLTDLECDQLISILSKIRL